MLNRLELGQYKEDTIGLFSNCRAFSLAYTVIEKARQFKKKQITLDNRVLLLLS